MKLNPDRVEKKSWTKIDKKGREEVWEWEEGPVLRAFRDEQLRKTGKIPTCMNHVAFFLMYVLSLIHI